MNYDIEYSEGRPNDIEYVKVARKEATCVESEYQFNFLISFNYVHCAVFS